MSLLHLDQQVPPTSAPGRLLGERAGRRICLLSWKTHGPMRSHTQLLRGEDPADRKATSVGLLVTGLLTTGLPAVVFAAVGSR